VTAAPDRCANCGSDAIRRRYALSRFDVYECARCTVRFRHPLPEPAELAAMYDDERYHASAYFKPAHDPLRAPEMRIYRRGLSDLAAMTSVGRLLDVGCGSGTFLGLAREAGWDAVGVELSQRHVATASAAVASHVWQGDFVATPFAPGSFDAITMWDFLEHVRDVREVLHHAHRLLAPRGVLLVFTIDCTSLFNRTGDVLHRLLPGGAVRPLELLYDARHNYYFTPAALTRALTASGFAIAGWRADRAYLGRWLSEPAPWYLVAGGVILDALSVAAGLPYRRTALCRRADAPAARPAGAR
jgi:2-polyprenyl-3-methyl-5-hydroxy-6-metoxy-1,4-benzoquinol methylase